MNFIKNTSLFLEQNRVMRHLLFWFVVFIINIPSGLLGQDPIWVVVVLNICIQIPQIIASYFFAYYLIPNFIIKKNYVYTLLLFLLASYIFSAMARILIVHFGEELVRMKPFEKESVYEILSDIHRLLVQYLPAIYSVTFQFLFIKYFMANKRIEENEMQMSKQKTESELKILKAQLNPHFLFNTLNNIYSLSLDNSPKTPIAIGKLSEILDHVLYKCNNLLVSLSSEIVLLKNYIELEKLRYDERLQITFETKIESDILIPPLLLLSLVENAFKHGAGEDSGSPMIDIGIFQKGSNFKFEISNTISNDYISKDKAKIGLSNITKQLDLIYADKYVLDIKQFQNSFTVILQINQI